MSKGKNSNGDYEVGYGKPPKETQFKPGQSGNKKGRPKGTKNLATLFNEVMSEKISIKEGNTVRKISKLEAIIQRTFNNALQGDLRAITTVIKIAKDLKLVEPEEQERRGGVLLMPLPITEEEWIEKYAKPLPDGAKEPGSSDKDIDDDS